VTAPVLRVVLGDQCSHALSALADLDPSRDVVLMAEVAGECTYVRHHRQKIALVLSAMRHFARALAARGVRVDYVRLEDPDNTGSLRGEVVRAVRRHGAARVVATEPGEWRVREDMLGWSEAACVPVELRDDDRFVCSVAAFAAWSEGRRTLRLEHFYREMRRRTGLLMEDGQPVGGRWNFDAENRKRLPTGLRPPAPFRVAPDAITRTVIDLVAARFPDHWGGLDAFAWPVTAAEAEAALDRFIADRLPHFGDFQDAMAEGEATLFHSLLSTSLNLGLLLPLQVCRRAEAAWRAGQAPLNAVEGFIRQILGWREYVRGLYWLRMPEYARLNALGADRSLPAFYWTADSGMACVDAVVRQTRDLAYAHHIQRLMVTGNFALLAGIDPVEVDEWYLRVYADAFEWVELPNTRGMALHADGGLMASKPYAASGKYIDRMSDHCRHCRYDVRETLGDRACPFNALYWDFVARHRARFRGNPRMAQMIRTLDRMDAAKVAAIGRQATAFLDRVAPRKAAAA